MASIFISSATLLLPGHRLHGKKIDLLVEDGKIKSLESKISDPDHKVEKVDGRGKYICPGFFDLNTHFGVPGYETKEDFATGIAAAAAGGFTNVCVQPNTNPPLHSRSEIALIINSTTGQAVNVFPIGAISKKIKGEELAEMFDMQSAGAVAFSDGQHSIQQAGLMSRALLYAKGIDALIMSFAQDESVSGGHVMNEGDVSTYLGMKGAPNLAETLMISRDLELAEYNDARIHFSTISTKQSVDLIKKAKARGLKVTCDVAAHHLVYTDEDVKSFDSHYKVNPPLRTKQDVKALIKGLKDGVIDAIVSQHTPQEVEFKNVEFQIANDGMIGLQTTLSLLKSAGLSPELIVEKIAINPRKVLGKELPKFEPDEVVDFVLFDFDETWTLDTKTNKSKSKNHPMWGKELAGKVSLICNNRLIINN